MVLEKLVYWLVIIQMSIRVVICYNTECSIISSTSPGQLMIAGLFDLHDSDTDSCGPISDTTVQEVEAILWTLKRLNDQNYIRGLKIGLALHDTCGQADIAGRNLFRVLPEYEYTTYTSCNESAAELFVGILGPSRSGPARLISSILSKRGPLQQYFQLTYSATAADLSNNELYPNLFRVIPSDTGLVEALIKLLEHLKWNYFAVVYSNEAYGISGLLEFKRLISRERICIAAELALSMHEYNGDRISEFFRTITHTFETKGVIYIGQREKAVEMLEKATSELTFIIAEGINLDMDKNIPSRGIISIGPTQKPVPSFQAHWNDIMANVTALRKASQLNPWLKELVEDRGRCALPNQTDAKVCTNDDLAAVNRKISPSIFTAYAIHAIHIYAYILKTLHGKHCSIEGWCAGLDEKHPKAITDEARITTLDYQNPPMDQSISDELIYESISFNENGDVRGETSSPTYEISIIKSGILNAMVGGYTDGTLSITKPEHLSDIAASQCVAKCEDCLQRPIADESVIIQGDFYIVGLIPVHNPGSDPLECGTIRLTSGNELAEALIYAVEKVNEKEGTLFGIFGNKRLGLIILNTCRTSLIMQKRVLTLYSESLAKEHMEVYSEKIIGFVGPYASSNAIPLAKLALDLKTVVVSYSATSPVLSDRLEYPNFLRMCPPDTKQVNAMLSFLDHYNWRYISVVYLDDNYGRTGFEVLEREAPNYNICIAQSLLFVEGSSAYIIADKLLVHPAARVVIIIAESSTTTVLIKAFDAKLQQNQKDDRFIFIGSESWGNQRTISQGTTIAVGSFTFKVTSSENKAFASHLETRKPDTASDNPWFYNYWQSKFDCNIPDSFEKVLGKKNCSDNDNIGSITQDIWTPFVIDSVIALSMGASKSLERQCGGFANDVCGNYYTNWKDVYESVRLTSVDNIRRRTFFDSNGEGNVGYDIYNIQERSSNPDEHDYVLVAKWTAEDGISFIDFTEDFPETKCPNERDCSKCPHMNVTANQTVAAVTSTSATDGWQTVAIVFIVLLVILIIANILVIIYVCIIKPRKATKANTAENMHYVDVTYLHPTSLTHPPTPPPVGPKPHALPNSYYDNRVAEEDEDGAPTYNDWSSRRSQTIPKHIDSGSGSSNSRVTVV